MSYAFFSGCFALDSEILLPLYSSLIDSYFAIVNITHVQTLEHPPLQPYRTLRRPADHEKQGIFVAEGEKVVRRLLESPLAIVSVLLTEEWFSRLEAELERRNPPDIFLAPKKVVETIVGFPLHQGIMAVGKIPVSPDLQALLSSLPQPHLLAAIDGLTNSENLGVLVRNCAAFGVQALLVGETSSSPYLRRAVRNSMGSIFMIPVIHTGNLSKSLVELKDRGIVTIAAHPHADRELASIGRLSSSCCVVFGSEGDGISANVLAACEYAAAVRMENGVDSLNVGSASAVFFYAVQHARESS